MASLDPLARDAFLRDLHDTWPDQELSVVHSSHLISDLERVCDYLIVLVASRVQVAGEVSELLARHRLLTAPRIDPASVPARPARHLRAARGLTRHRRRPLRRPGRP